MEFTEDKLIADKLGTLHTLPDGYFPNLDNKWAIIEAGLGSTKSKKWGMFWLTGIAASLIIGGLAGYLFFGSGSALPVKNINQAIVAKAQPAPKTLTIKASTETKQKKLILPHPVKNQLLEPVEPLPVAENTDIKEALTEPSTDTMIAATAVPADAKLNTNKRKKLRYVQMDFFDTVKTKDVPSPLYAKGFHFKAFQSTNNSPQNATAVGAGGSLLRVKL